MHRMLISFAAALCAAGVSFFAVESAHAQNRTMFGNSPRSGISNGSSTTGGLGSTMFGNSGGLGSGGSGTTGGLSGVQNPYGMDPAGLVAWAQELADAVQSDGPGRTAGPVDAAERAPRLRGGPR